MTHANGRHLRITGAHAVDTAVGSLTWQIGHMMPGDILLRHEQNRSTRRVCMRAMSVVEQREPEREYTFSLWHALHHKGTGAGMRLYRIDRVR